MQEGRMVAYFSEKLSGAALNYTLRQRIVCIGSNFRDLVALPLAKRVCDSYGS